MITTREAFKILYRYTRRNRRNSKIESAFWLVESALEDLNYDFKWSIFKSFLEVDRAVLWAVHWRFFEPTLKDVPAGMSERHHCFECGPEDTTTWYARKLPG